MWSCFHIVCSLVCLKCSGAPRWDNCQLKNAQLPTMVLLWEWKAEGLVGSPDVEGKDPGTHAVEHVAPPALAYVRVYSTGRQGEGSRRQRNQNIKQSCNAS